MYSKGTLILILICCETIWAPTTGRCIHFKGDSVECLDAGCCYCKVSGLCGPRIYDSEPCKVNQTSQWVCLGESFTSQESTTIVAVVFSVIGLVIVCTVIICIVVRCKKTE